MNIKHANYVMQILREGNITNAAKNLHVSQPALSQTVKSVETAIGAQIFIRNTNPIVLTAAGRKYIAAAKRIITINANLLHEIADIKHEEYGSLHLGIPSNRAMIILPTLVPKFIKKYPNIKLDISEKGSPVTEEAVVNGTVDIGIVTTIPTRDDLVYELIEKEAAVLVVNKHTKLAHRIPQVKPIDITEAKEESFVTISLGHSVRKIQDTLFANNDMLPKVFLETSSIEVAKRITAVTNSVFICPEVYLDKDYLDKGQCLIYPLLGVENRRYCYICYRKDYYLRQYAKDFMELVLEEGKKYSEKRGKQ
jgi:DNA-binding transcriptional LysR family regulator